MMTILNCVVSKTKKLLLTVHMTIIFDDIIHVLVHLVYEIEVWDGLNVLQQRCSYIHVL